MADEPLSRVEEILEGGSPPLLSRIEKLLKEGGAGVTEQTVSGWGFTKNTGDYTKPSGGIPASDLASAVQTSLGKAETALQQHQSLSGYATETYVQTQIAAIPDELPSVTTTDNGKVLAVNNGEWSADNPVIVSGTDAQVANAVNDYLTQYGVPLRLSEEIKQALLDCFEHVAWINEDGQQYYDALYAALYPSKTVVSISAAFNQGSAVIYETDSLDTLKQYLVVTATYDDSSTGVVTNYTLSGTLEVGTSTITVSYGGKTTTFSVTVSEYNPLPPGYTKYDYISADGNAYFQIQNTSNPPVPPGYTVRTIAQQTTHSDSNVKVASGGGNKDAYIAYAAYSKTAGKAGAYYGTTVVFTDVENLLTAPTEFITKFAVDGVTTTTTNSSVSQTVVTPSGGTTFKSSNYIRIGYSGASGSNFVGKIYLVEVKNTSDELTHQFVPCKRDSDSVAGMYDIVTSTFYASSGSSQFTAGND